MNYLETFGLLHVLLYAALGVAQVWGMFYRSIKKRDKLQNVTDFAMKG